MLSLLVTRHNHLQTNDDPSKTDDLILLICSQIRISMHKEMRIFCIRLLTQIDNIPNNVVEVMMKKEESSYSKFTQIGSQVEQRAKMLQAQQLRRSQQLGKTLNKLTGLQE